jgi:hypothetical protein
MILLSMPLRSLYQVTLEIVYGLGSSASTGVLFSTSARLPNCKVLERRRDYRTNAPRASHTSLEPFLRRRPVGLDGREATRPRSQISTPTSTSWHHPSPRESRRARGGQGRLRHHQRYRLWEHGAFPTTENHPQHSLLRGFQARLRALVTCTSTTCSTGSSLGRLTLPDLHVAAV